MKQLFPGDPDFTLENYSSLPYAYVVNAYVRGTDLYRERMHDLERPTALVGTFLANKDRDPKKNKMLNYLDLSFYKPHKGAHGADAVYGSAMLAMAKRRALPSWALFCFRDVTSNASSDYTPENCALVAKDALLLHPIKVDDGWEGMLIALESASEQKRTFVSDDGEEYELFVPHIHTKVIAEEGVVLS